MFAAIVFGILIAWLVADIAIFGDDTTTSYFARFARKADAS